MHSQVIPFSLIKDYYENWITKTGFSYDPTNRTMNERDIVAFQSQILVLCETEFHNITDLTQNVILELNRCKIAPYSFHIQQVEIVDNRPKMEVIIKNETT